jgi:transposase InsO family protein
VRFAFIDAKKAQYPVSVLCSVMKVQRSGYYGSPRVHRELRKRGTHVCRHRVARLMRKQELQARPRRRFVNTTDSRHSMPTPPNVLDRDGCTAGGRFARERKDEARAVTPPATPPLVELRAATCPSPQPLEHGLSDDD